MAALKVLSADLQHKVNMAAHRTSAYITDKLVVRRADSFSMQLQLDRAVTAEDQLSWWAETGPSKSKHAVSIPISSSSSGQPWSAVSNTISDTSISVTISSPANAPIGYYSMGVKVKSGRSDVSQPLGGFIMIFNAWHRDDAVYMENEDERNEYVLNETTRIYVGSAKANPSYKMWDLGQFEERVLNICLRLMDSSIEYRRNTKTDISRRGDPVYLTRILSAMGNPLQPKNSLNDYFQKDEPATTSWPSKLKVRTFRKPCATKEFIKGLLPESCAHINKPGTPRKLEINVQDDNGCLVGNWSGDYEGGETPTKWNGTAEILRRWNDSGPVRFGQCWVYGGVFCTVLRSLGIPARIVTNFDSAHDTDETLSVDRYFDNDGKEIFDSADSVWNFHVWNEAYFVRKDLGDSMYDGWQVLDATPQEQSGGIFCLGPCSVNAVRLGHVDKKFDAAFVFCEVNGDKVDWLYANNELRRLRVNTKSIGKFTSTKAVGSTKRHDITNLYKADEGSTTEREVFELALSKLNNSGRTSARGSGPVAFSARNTEPVPKPDFEGTFKQSSDPEVGKDVTFILVLKNTSDQKSNLHVKMNATAVVYTNAQVNEICTKEEPVSFEPKEEKNISLSILYSQYGNALTPDNMIKAVAVCEDEKGGKLLVESLMTLKAPPILLKANTQPCLNEPFDVEIVVTNQLSVDTGEGILTIEGTGLIKEPIQIEMPSLQKHEKISKKIKIIPYRHGERFLLANLSSDKLCDVKGVLPVNISPA